ncbi:MAG: hypothetical protein JWM82_134 [Myxococcales bacterium]|nr:hypothetical protein [Myxococcales bacterium]
MGALVTIGTWSTPASAKKQHTLKMDPTAPAEPEHKGPVPPEADANGHVNFGNPQKEGLGRVTVKAANGDQIQVYLEGRYFGDTPITIYSVPKGDYIVEGTFVSSGKQVAKPVSVSENEEASVELAEKKVEPTAEEAKASTGFMSGEISPKRLLVAKVLAVTTVVGLVTCVTFGILEKGKESDYTKTAMGTTASDNIKKSGQNDALISNVGLFVAGAALLGTAFAAYPMFKKSTTTEGEKPAEPAPTAFLVAPMVGNGATGAAALFRF